MRLDIYVIDAFAFKTFEGNPAAVIPLENWLPDDILLKIAAENNLSETAFIYPSDDHFQIRWFSPKSEIALCGHATLAAAYVIYEHLKHPEVPINFKSREHTLHAYKNKHVLAIQLPVSELFDMPIPDDAFNILGRQPLAAFKGRDDYMFVFNSEKDIKQLTPDINRLLAWNTRGVICTSRAKDYDFVSRFFAPSIGLTEDPVTGSAHTMLVPYWACQLKKNELVARQISKRKGVLYCRNLGNTVELAGKAVTYLIGKIFI